MLSTSLDRVALVVAHPDDEILWFSSIVRRVAKLVVCYLDVPERPDWSTGRRRAALEYPLSNSTFLGLTESVSFAGADWNAPVATEQGLEVVQRKGTLPGFDAERYRANYHALVAQLSDLLRGYSAVVTHNPWGEYGHEEHVQVHRAVIAVQRVVGYDVWYSNYCSDRSYPLMLRAISGFRSAYETLPTEPALARDIESLYRRCGCWTWPFDDYVHFAHESFIKSGSAASSVVAGSTCPLNFIRLTEPAAPRPTVSRTRRLMRSTRRRIEKLMPRNEKVRAR